jgi:hypothetical protein
MEYFLAGIGIIVIIVFAFLFFLLCGFIINKVLKRKLKPEFAFIITAVILVLFLFKHYIFFTILFSHYIPSPAKEIFEKVEFPISVFIQDDELKYDIKYKHQILIKRYLDGTHLKTLAIDGNNNKIYLYQAKSNDTDIKEILENVELFDSIMDLPKIDYHVKINTINDTLFNTKRYHADITRIINTKKNVEIAYSYRYWSYSTFLFKVLNAKKSYKYGVKKGQGPYAFIEEVLFDYPSKMKLTYLESFQNFDNR